MTHIRVDKEECISCGACVSECPNGMFMDNDGKANVKDQEKADANTDLEGVCPVGAIKRD